MLAEAHQQDCCQKFEKISESAKQGIYAEILMQSKSPPGLSTDGF